MDTLDLSFHANEVKTEANNYHTVTVSVSNVDKSDILDNFKLEDIIDHFKVDEILDYIGVEEVKEYFDLIENE